MQYVYLLRAGENHYKVGVAKSIKNRLAGIQTSNPVKIEVVSTKLLDDAYAVERELHERLKEWNVSGEWFSLEPSEVINLLVTLNDYPEPDLAMNIRLRDILAQQAEAQKRIEHKLRFVVNLAQKQLDEKKAAREATKLKGERIEENKLLKPTDNELLEQAIKVIKEQGIASTSFLQRELGLGYGRASRVLSRLEKDGKVGPGLGSKRRAIYM